MTSVKSLNNKVILLERKVQFGDNGGIRVGGGLLEVNTSNNKVTTATSRISFGSNAGSISQGANTVAIGNNAGAFNQSTLGNGIAIGLNAGQTNQGQHGIAIGANAGASNQFNRTVAIGNSAGISNQGISGIAIGFETARQSQSENGIALGRNTGDVLQGGNSIAIGAFAIGQFAGVVTQGTQAIAIGAYAGVISQNQGSIVIDASGSAFDSIDANQRGLFIRPIRPVGAATSANGLAYDPTTKEITHVSTKTFVIDHPIHQDKYLVHACLEGPEAGVYYRGKGEITNDESVEIRLPEYAKNFYNFTVQVTPINSRIVYGVTEVEDGKFKVLGYNGKFFWTVQATRQEIEVEPRKSDVVVKGDGPYTYISN